jgi:hypothetical protein
VGGLGVIQMRRKCARESKGMETICASCGKPTRLRPHIRASDFVVARRIEPPRVA